ncbi:hypothetical protein AX16_004472 [Volvariella volvacea WC 439]|nr:hypothetical protein AX16_004472 [Volvariella volvacea WC 439]
MVKASFAPLLVALFSAQAALAWFRVACTRPLVQERVDPIISPGRTPSQHVHTIHGGSNFAANGTFDSLRASRCTNCVVTQDKSAYWFPKLYFRDPRTGQYEPVGDGGLLVYYQNRGVDAVRNGGKGLKAFPPGFKMISGNPAARSRKLPDSDKSQAGLAEQAIFWACLRYTTPYPEYHGHGWPTTDCEAGFNARVHMPACWDGINVDSPDHRSHVAYLSQLDQGTCPPSHPVTLMKMFYEITWDVHAFANRWNPAVDRWPFVYATGDPTGYSWHADFQNGWDVGVLQNAIDQCDNPNDDTGNGITEACRFFTVQSRATADTCKISPHVNEQIDGVLNKLPGWVTSSPIAGPSN